MSNAALPAPRVGVGAVPAAFDVSDVFAESDVLTTWMRWVPAPTAIGDVAALVGTPRARTRPSTEIVTGPTDERAFTICTEPMVIGSALTELFALDAASTGPTRLPTDTMISAPTAPARIFRAAFTTPLSDDLPRSLNHWRQRTRNVPEQ